MPSLLETQHGFLRAITRRESADVAAQIADGTFTPAERLDVYRNTFVSVLTNALRVSFPAVYRLVGGEFFEAAAENFIDAKPPRCAYLNAYGAGFAEFLAQFPAVAELPYLADVARLEWAVNGALHAQDVAPLDPEALAEIAAVLPEQVTFVAHPSVTCLRLDYPARAIWQAVLAEDDAALGAIDLSSGPEWLLVERDANGVEVSALAECEWRFAHALCAGESLAAAIDASPDGDIPLFLARHLAAGRIVGFRISDPQTRETHP
jgi:hypothetical protein